MHFFSRQLKRWRRQPSEPEFKDRLRNIDCDPVKNPDLDRYDTRAKPIPVVHETEKRLGTKQQKTHRKPADATSLSEYSRARSWKRPATWLPPLPLSLFDSHRLLRASLRASPTMAQLAARNRLLDSYQSESAVQFRLSLRKHFNDLDILLFQSVLHGRVKLGWGVRGKDIAGTTFSMFHHARHRPTQYIIVHISQAWSSSLHVSKERLWGIQIHEMLHSYINVTTSRRHIKGATKEMCFCDAEIFHGPLFAASFKCLVDALGFPGLTADRVYAMYLKQCHSWNNERERRRNYPIKPRLIENRVNGRGK